MHKRQIPHLETTSWLSWRLAKQQDERGQEANEQVLPVHPSQTLAGSSDTDSLLFLPASPEEAEASVPCKPCLSATRFPVCLWKDCNKTIQNLVSTSCSKCSLWGGKWFPQGKQFVLEASAKRWSMESTSTDSVLQYKILPETGEILPSLG